MMTSPPTRKAPLPQRISGWCLLGCLLTLVLLTTTTGLFAQQKKIGAGEHHDLKFGDAKDPLVLRFRFCPAGTLPEISDDNTDVYKFKPNPVELDGFWIAETELSQEDYETIRQLGGDLPTIEELIERGGKPRLKSFTHDTKPVMAITVREAVQIAQVLQAKQLPGSSVSLEYAVRLPSYAEWQYACRAIQSDYDSAVKYRHFYGWPENPKTMYGGLEGDRPELDKMFPDKETSDSFGASQDEVMRLIKDMKEKENKRRSRFVLYSFLNQNTGCLSTFGLYFKSSTFRNLRGAEKYRAELLQPVSANKELHNKWNLLHMHGNIAEWTIGSSKYQNIGETWNELQIQFKDDAHKIPEDDWQFHLAGGGVLDADYKRFTIGGALRVENIHVAIPERMHLYVPGVRLVMTARLADDWKIAMRANALKALGKAVDLVALYESLDQEYKDVGAMSILQTGQPIDDMSYYLSFARFQQDKKRDVLLESLKAYGKTLPKNDSSTILFLNSTAQLIDEQRN